MQHGRVRIPAIIQLITQAIILREIFFPDYDIITKDVFLF